MGFILADTLRWYSEVGFGQDRDLAANPICIVKGGENCVSTDTQTTAPDSESEGGWIWCGWKLHAI